LKVLDPAPPTVLATAAENYAANGWSVFPVKPRDKTPLTVNGVHGASSKVEQVRAWWTRWPDANIGLNCGKSGLVVIDLDKHGERDGMADWKQLMAERHFTVDTSTSVTGGGGQHLLFKAPAGVSIKNSAGRIAPGVDVRGEGGYIVLPPSIHPSGKPYEWLGTTQTIAPLPLVVVDILTHEPDPWQIFTLRDAFAPREPLVWIVEGIIPEASLSIWYGAPGALKSLILADLAVCVSVGSRWLATPGNPTTTGYATTPGAVMWLDFDNGQRRTHERIAALARARKLSQAAPIYYASMPEPALNTGDTESIRALAARLVDRNVRLLVIDNLGVVAGEAEENTADMQVPMAGLRWLAETGVAVIVLHHQRKSSTTTAKTRKGESLRGHGSIEAKLDLAIQIDREDASTEITMTPTKTRGPSIKPFTANFVFENDERHELTSARFWPVDAAAEREADEMAERQLIVDELKKNGPLTASDLYARLGGNKQNLFDLLRKMNMAHEIAKKPGPRNSFLLYMP